MDDPPHQKEVSICISLLHTEYTKVAQRKDSFLMNDWQCCRRDELWDLGSVERTSRGANITKSFDVRGSKGIALNIEA